MFIVNAEGSKVAVCGNCNAGSSLQAFLDAHSVAFFEYVYS